MKMDLKKLNIENVIREFRESENSRRSRSGAFKINSSFEQAMKKILKVKPEPKKRKGKPDDK